MALQNRNGAIGLGLQRSGSASVLPFLSEHQRRSNDDKASVNVYTGRGYPVIAFWDSVRCQTPVNHLRGSARRQGHFPLRGSNDPNSGALWCVEVHLRQGPRVTQGRGICLPPRRPLRLDLKAESPSLGPIVRARRFGGKVQPLV